DDVIEVEAQGWAVALGLGMGADKSSLTNLGHLDVVAEGGEVGLAAGMVAFGKKNRLVNAVDDEDLGMLHVGASGDVAIGIGMGVVGSRSRVVNEGELIVYTPGENLAVALGMGALGSHNRVRNEGDLVVWAEARADEGPDNEGGEDLQDDPM